LVKRLVSGGSGRAIVTKSGGDLVSHLQSEGKKLRAQAERDENVLANLVGEERYHQDKLQKDSLTNELVAIGKDESKVKSFVRPKIHSSKTKKMKDGKQ